MEASHAGRCIDSAVEIKTRCTTIDLDVARRAQISTWAKIEDKLRAALIEANQKARKGPKRDGDAIVRASSAAARKFTLHPGTSRKYAAAEAELHKLYREKRQRGLKISAHWLRINMKRIVRSMYGDEAALHFKASPVWLFKFTNHYNMSLRKRTNKKNMSVDERAAKCKRWHARFRRRLSRSKQLSPKWGRWLPQDRLSIDQASAACTYCIDIVLYFMLVFELGSTFAWRLDQVPCNLREGDTRTYTEKGDKRVWIAGNKNDDGKRFCTLQIAARCCNGSPNEPRHGQPKITIVFRGKGQRITQKEKDGRHLDVNVRFQPKAWFDDALCASYAKTEMKEICAKAKSEGRQSVVICDNLSGQTTQEFADALKKHNCKRHLLPAGVTDELQLIDDGVGIAVKNEMGNLFDLWAMEGGDSCRLR